MVASHCSALECKLTYLARILVIFESKLLKYKFLIRNKKITQQNFFKKYNTCHINQETVMYFFNVYHVVKKYT